MARLSSASATSLLAQQPPPTPQRQQQQQVYEVHDGDGDAQQQPPPHKHRRHRRRQHAPAQDNGGAAARPSAGGLSQMRALLGPAHPLALPQQPQQPPSDAVHVVSGDAAATFAALASAAERPPPPAVQPSEGVAMAVGDAEWVPGAPSLSRHSRAMVSSLLQTSESLAAEGGTGGSTPPWEAATAERVASPDTALEYCVFDSSEAGTLRS